ncbi:YYY domain-containing protein [Methanomicrobium sp. W14]|uniref:DUF2298 domain-containing protein n=1 Tax=Methanomicrobium sp. W14 TaxID=2817839 RepID=UPI001FD9F562|nr:DUF2298 domain-containing protein [Methanomicrobium sp. W14]MBP2133018.1 YYY domain-containing protein [Methanomicrobium sp. W14]
MTAVLQQIFSVILWIFILKFLQISLWPALKKAAGDFSYGISYPASILLFTLISWYCGLFHLPVYLSLVIFVALFIHYLHKKEYTKQEFLKNIRWDVVFFLLFIFMLEVRFLNPSISYAEKFMDHAFLASIMNNPVIPPADPWYSGGNLDVYYYLGHWIFGALGDITGIKSTIVFNFMLPTVFANAGVALYASGRLLLKKYDWLPLLTLFIVNPAFIYHIFLGEGIQTIMWESTRTIDGAITEYPIFSMLWGDPHAHVISLFNQAFFLFLLTYVYIKWNKLDNNEKWVMTALLSLSLGSMPLINTWDILVYAPVILLFGLLIFLKERKENPDKEWIKAVPLRILVAAPAMAVLIYLPYYLMMNASGIEGVGIVGSPTEPVAFLLVYGFFLAVLYLECLKDLREKPHILALFIPFLLLGYIGAGLCAVLAAALISRKNKSAQDIIAAIGMLIIIFTETVYLKDNMGEEYFRMNTVFKLSIIAWMMLGISSFVYIGKFLGNKYPGEIHPLSGRKKCAAAVMIVALFMVPVILPDLNYGYGGKTLDGSDWLKNSYPYDYDAIQFLEGLGGNISIVEAENGDYTYYSRISSMTGYNTIIGMPFHEQMWRGDSGLVGDRMSDVRQIYENTDKCLKLMEKYGMDYIYVGTPEKERYGINLPCEDLEEVYKNDNVTIYSIKKS